MISVPHPNKAEMLLRLFTGVVMLLSGIGKFMATYYGEGGMLNAMAGGFEGTVFPVAIATAFLTIVPVLELILGVWLLSGWERVWALFSTGILIVLFLIGHLLTNQDYTVLALLILVIGMALMLPSGWHYTTDK